jgi:hypothetical protein
MSTLTHEDLNQLKAFFTVDEHEFDYGKNAYIKEKPISERIESVDPAWSFEIKSIVVRPSAGDGGKEVGTVTVHAAMTIKGSTRESTGMAVILKSDEKEEQKWVDKKRVNTGVMYTIEANQAEKSATTDALKRCARLFGIGRYMLDFGNEVNDEASLKRWLDKRQPIDLDAWNKDNMTTFWKRWTSAGIDGQDILAALEIKGLGEWKHSVSLANERMELTFNNQASGQ